MEDIELEEQKQRFLDICRREIHREGIENLLDYLCKSDFFTAPASTRYHGAYKGGLCQHSLDVYEYAKEVALLYKGGTISQESLAIASLFHDMCKVHFYKEEFRNQKKDGVWVQVPYYAVEERFAFGGHGSKSVYLVQWYMKLNQDEAVAINCHMGFADATENTTRNVSQAFEAYPLAWIIHIADEAATFLLHRRNED